MKSYAYELLSGTQNDSHEYCIAKRTHTKEDLQHSHTEVHVVNQRQPRREHVHSPTRTTFSYVINVMTGGGVRN